MVRDVLEMAFKLPGTSNPPRPGVFYPAKLRHMWSYSLYILHILEIRHLTPQFHLRSRFIFFHSICFVLSFFSPPAYFERAIHAAVDFAYNTARSLQPLQYF